MSDPTTGKTQFEPNPAAAGIQMAADARKTAQPSTASLPSSLDASGGPSFNNPQPQQPSMVRPSFLQASQMGAQPGGVNALSPGLNKAGKLVTLLSSGLQGALAGRAAQEQATVASGGRRSGGAGMAFEAGYNLPAQRQQIQQGLAQQRAQTELTESQSELVDTPYGKMPPALAKVIFGASIAEQGKLGAAQIGAGARTGAAQIGATARTGAAEIGAAARVKAAQLGLGPMANVPQDLQDQFGLPAQLPLRMLNQAESAQNRPLTVVQGETGPSVVNKPAAAAGRPGATTSLGVGPPRLGGVVQVGDPDNPGGTVMRTGGQAVRGNMAGTQSASVQVPRAAAKGEVPTKIGDQKLAFNTAMQHADLLTAAVRALDNGDEQTLSSLKNRFKTEFGAPGPITTKTIGDAYTREITKMLSSGHLTDSEIGTVGSTLNVNKNSMGQSLGVIAAYRQLAQSKMNMLNQQKQSAINQSQPGQKQGAQPSGRRVIDFTQ